MCRCYYCYYYHYYHYYYYLGACSSDSTRQVSMTQRKTGGPAAARGSAYSIVV